MIHGGIKYALGGFTTPSSETIANMPSVWETYLAGKGAFDLSAVRVLSRDYYLFSDSSVSSRVTAFFGSKSIRGRVAKMPASEHPQPFSHAAFKGALYRLADIVVDTPSLVSELANGAPGRVLQADARAVRGSDGGVTHLQLQDGSTLSADCYIFAAGQGNGALIEAAGIDVVTMQRRPLKQVLVRAPGLPETYAHGVSLGAGAKPRITITTHTRKDGERVWYLGGNLAETGVARTDAEQVLHARAELGALFPWIEWHNADIRTFDVDRAEPATENQGRPDTPYVKRVGNVLICWPTKLTLAPLLADEVMAQLKHASAAAASGSLPRLPVPPVGNPPWEDVFDHHR